MPTSFAFCGNACIKQTSIIAQLFVLFDACSFRSAVTCANHCSSKLASFNSSRFLFQVQFFELQLVDVDSGIVVLDAMVANDRRID